VDDAVLVRRMLRGDQCAFEQFFDAYFDRVFRFAVRRTGDADAAQDIAQSTLAIAVRKLETWRGEAAFFTWLCSICRREVSAYWRRMRHQPSACPLDESGDARGVLEQLAADGDGPEQALQRRELAHLVQLTLDYLPDRYGDLLEWKYIEGCAVLDIAARLHSTPKAVESMLTRARQAFRKGFAELSRASEMI
jgi:RNA polymerase sigma-70 factor, ECF subfamily